MCCVLVREEVILPPLAHSVFLFMSFVRSLEGVIGDPVCMYVCMYLLARSVFAAWKALCLSWLWNYEILSVKGLCFSVSDIYEGL
jgi:hypothetical protein